MKLNKKRQKGGKCTFDGIDVIFSELHKVTKVLESVHDIGVESFAVDMLNFGHSRMRKCLCKKKVFATSSLKKKVTFGSIGNTMTQKRSKIQ